MRISVFYMAFILSFCAVDAWINSACQVANQLPGGASFTLHPHLSLILHTAVFLFVFFVIFNQMHGCMNAERVPDEKMTTFYFLREIWERKSTIKFVWGQCFKIRKLLLRWGFYCNFSHFVHYMLITSCQPRPNLSEPMLDILNETLGRLYLGVRACFLIHNAVSCTVLARVQELDCSRYKRKKHWFKLKKCIKVWYKHVYLLYAHKLFNHHSTILNHRATLDASVDDKVFSSIGSA